VPHRHPAYRRRERESGFDEEQENLSSRCEGSGASGGHHKCLSTDAGHRGRSVRSRAEGPVMGLDRRGAGGQLESYSGQPFGGGALDESKVVGMSRRLDAGSRMRRESHVRF